MSKFVVVSYFTRGSIYELEALRLLKSLEHFNIDHHIAEQDDAGSWEENCAMKPSVIIAAMNLYKKPIVFLDADSVVRQYPIWFETLDCDVAAHYRNGFELLSGTLYFDYSEESLRLLRHWRDEMLLNPDEWDQRVLQQLLENYRRNGLCVGELPASYCQIFDTMAHEGYPVIEHYQASRRTRKAGLVAGERRI